MTNETADFEQWMDFLREHARKKGGTANFPDEWRDDYDDGKTPEESWRDAWE